MATPLPDEDLMDAIVQEHVPKCAEKSAGVVAVDDFDGDSPAPSPSARKGAQSPESADDWDKSSSEDGTEGSIVATMPGGQSNRYRTLAGALQSKKLPTGSTVRLPAGTHKWPGGDLYHSIAGCGRNCVIEGNAGGGYFFYLRRNGLQIADVTIRGSRGGRSHIYVDQLQQSAVRRCRMEGEGYNHCVQVLGSSDVLIEQCDLTCTVHAGVHVFGSRRVRVSGNTVRGGQECTALINESSGSANGNRLLRGIPRHAPPRRGR
eukprot:TRINITY_DN12030_c0_g2_i3.p2 TRINITY_DN12030_c0_g2~~TRINITY_DN12030_c0_g2_i3.p2  ORF type:complete len:262 (+),score=44.91 TRINITY_DN12030_c0_g2_i3:1431-2216(+)